MLVHSFSLIASMLCVIFLLSMLSHICYGDVRLRIIVNIREFPAMQKTLISEPLKDKPDDCKGWKFQKVVNQIQLPWRYRKLVAPWIYHNDTVIYSSQIFEKEMNKLLQLQVPGINSTSLQVLEILTNNGCLPIIWGGAVRDTILQRDVSDIDAEVSCDFEVLDSICRKQWGDQNCKRRSSSETLMIGNKDNISDDSIDVADVGLWDHTFYENATLWEYTSNSLGYYLPVDSQPGYLLDMTSRGLDDTCNKHIAIPVQHPLWEDWFKESNLCKKVYRAWKLRYKNFTFSDNDTAKFIEEKAEWCITKDPKKFIDFYCNQTIGYNANFDVEGLPLSGLYQICNQQSTCSKFDKFMEYSELYKHDLGVGIYDKYILKLVAMHSAVCIYQPYSSYAPNQQCVQTFNATTGKYVYSCSDQNAECKFAILNYGRESLGYASRVNKCLCKPGYMERTIFTYTQGGSVTAEQTCISNKGVIKFDCNGTTYPCGEMGANFGTDNPFNHTDECFCTQSKDVAVWGHCTNAASGRPCSDKNASCIGDSIGKSRCVCSEGFYHDSTQCVKIPDDAIYLDCNKIYPIDHPCSGYGMKSVSLENGKCCCFKI